MKVAVIGGGVIGLFTAYYLGRSGAEVTVFDKNAIPNQEGSSKGDSRLWWLLNESLNDSVYALASRPLWREFENATSMQRKLLLHRDLLGLAPGCAPEFLDALTIATNLGVSFQTLDLSQLREKYPKILNLPEDYKGIRQVTDGIVYALGVLNALKGAVHNLGNVTLKPGTEVYSVQNIAEGSITINEESTPFDKVVFAAGTGTQKLINDYVIPFNPGLLPGDASLNLDTWLLVYGIFEQTTEPYQELPSVYEVTNDPDVIYYTLPVPRDDGTFEQSKYKIGANFPVVAPLTIESVRGMLQEYVASRFGNLFKTPPEEWHNCSYTVSGYSSRIGTYLLSFLSSDKTSVIFGADSGLAFKNAPTIGFILSEMTLTGNTVFNIEEYNIENFLKYA